MCKRLFILFTSFVFVLSLVSTAGAQPNGFILFEYWFDIPTVDVSALTGDPAYPDSPDDAEWRDRFEGPVDWADNYGSRARGFLYPPADGDYTFWISGDDFEELYLSTDDDPANAALIAEVPGWTSHLEWDKYPEQMSAPITLVGGQKYYIESIMKEAGGGDSMTVAWAGPEIGDTLTIIEGAFLSPVIRADDPLPVIYAKAQNPNPADGAVDYDGSSVEWTAGISAVSHKVYLSADATIDDADLAAETDLTIHLATLDPGVTYSWRVDEVEADGAVVEGDVWSFTTLPLEAHFPSPEDGAKSQELDAQLSWTAGKGVIMHDVYFGTDEAAVAAADPSTFKGKLMVTSYDPGALALETTYYWKIDEFSVTGTNPGPVWSFTTLGAVPITDPDLLLYYDFETGEGSVAIDQSGHSNHGQFMGTPEWTTGPFGGALSIVLEDVDYIQTADSLGVTSNNITVTGWVFHEESPAAWSGILTHRPSDNQNNLGLQHDGAQLRYMWGPDLYWQFESGLMMPNGEWYFAALAVSPDQATLYLNGVENTATNVAPHDPISFDTLINVGGDPVNSLGRIQTSLIDEVRLYNKTLSDAEILKLATPHIVDVTAPGDVVKGVPDEARDGSVAGWPDNEHPALAVDDDVTTKYLHFKGEVEPTGFVVEPAMGATVVTGLTLTTANDAVERDPASYEISGSNESIDGPYELIAAGDVVDFTQEAVWPRFTMNATPITFANTVAYKYYQVMFPTVRDAGSANSMQIAEVELLGVAAPVGHWMLDGDAVDVSGNGNDGTLVGDPQWVAGMVDGAIELDGVDDFVDCGNSELLDITGDITVACWIKVDLFDKNWQAIVTHGDNSWRVHRSSGSDNVAWGTSGLSPTDLTGTTNVNDAEWHHVAGVYNGAQKLLYIDGALDASADSTGNINSSTFNVNIGENNQATGRFFDGLIDDVRIYNKALPALQIRDIMSPPPPAGGANIILVSGNHDFDGDGIVDDFMLRDILEAEGHTVDYQPGNWTELDDAKIGALNAADLVIISRASNSGDYDDGEEPTQWNSIMTPMIVSSTHLTRSSRWKLLDSTSLLDLAPAVMELADGTQIEAMDGAVGLSSFIDAAPGNGTVLATGDGLPWIIEWEAGVEYYDGAGQTAGGPRVFFVAGTQELEGVSNWGEWNLTPAGLEIYLDTVDRLINPPAPTIAWVSYHAADDEPHTAAADFGFTQAPDIEYTDLLKAQGYNVVRVVTSQTPDVEFLNTMDLVIISRTASSGHYSGGGATLWNSVTAPTINLNGYTLRSSRMGFTDGTTMVDTTGDVKLTATDPTHPIFAGIALTDGTMDNLYAEGAVPLTTDETILSRGISINNNNIDDEGTLLATIAEVSADTGPVGGMVIAEYPAGATMENSSGSPTDVLGGPRLVFLTGSREPSGVTGGQAAALYDLYPDGEQMFLNAVEYMLP
jgi:hypothetical protein